MHARRRNAALTVHKIIASRAVCIRRSQRSENARKHIKRLIENVSKDRERRRKLEWQWRRSSFITQSRQRKHEEQCSFHYF